ncbi:MAG TPA: tRNA adenosine(34) deaminase TadA [Candidatus Polarisedimenticolia bacterium]|jgi:tRNA(adenine34) deaminase|nr:tRNA adenosine(34) deaminase TadA [Candidatus Polarisedimenticolia bacterium]
MNLVKNSELDENYIHEALRLARRAARKGEVPIGALLVVKDQVLARAGNATVTRRDPTAHAEVLVLRQAAKRLGNHRLAGSILYVTLEPCIMCLGAMVQARIGRCVFGASDPRVGAAGLLSHPALRRGLNHRLSIDGPVLPESCAAVLQSFFRERRRKGRPAATPS